MIDTGNSPVFIDTSYKFADTSKERITISMKYSTDSSFQFLNFKYFRRIFGSWKLMSSFDSLEIQYGFGPDHRDFNGDGVVDYDFLEGNGTRSNYFEHLILFDTSARNFRYINGFEKLVRQTLIS